MPKANVPLLSFNGGAVSPLALARVDVERLRLSAEEMTNWLPKTQGPMRFRPGLRYLGASRNNGSAQFIDFVASTTDTALLELTSGAMRVWKDDALLARPSVATTISNGTFANATGWTDASTGSGLIGFVGALHMNAISRGGVALCRRTITVPAGSVNKEHALRIVVSRGPVTFRCGSAAGSDNYVRTATLASGWHDLAFTPAGPFVIEFETTANVLRIVGSVSVTPAGPVVLPTPWTGADLPYVQWAQSADVIFVACAGRPPYRIERRSERSWAVVQYQPIDGPFRAQSSDIRVMPNGTRGGIILYAERRLFTPDMVGSLMRIGHDGQKGSFDLGGDDIYSDPIRVSGVKTGTFNDRIWGYNISGTWSGTLRVQRSFDGPDSGFAQYPASLQVGNTIPITTNGFRENTDGDENAIVWYRVGFTPGSYVSGVATVTFSYQGGGGSGIVRILSVTGTGQVAGAEVVEPLSGTTWTRNWELGAFSAEAGWPSSVALYEGRLWWFGGAQVYGSVSDAYDSFDQAMEGDAGPIIRSIGEGPVDSINFALPLQRLIVGTAGAELSVKSSSFDEPLTPSAFSIKPISTQGSAAGLRAVRIDGRGLFVQRSARKLFEVVFAADSYDYVTRDLSLLNPEITAPGIVCLAAQRQPDTRIHAVLADGTVAVLTYKPDEDMVAWSRVETDGYVERAVVLPGLTEDQVYYHVRRRIGATTVRYLEKWAREDEASGGLINLQTDCAIVRDGAPTATLTGLTHLEGRQVVAWADGASVDGADGTPLRLTVTGGAVMLPAVAAKIAAGLPYEGRWKSTKLAYAAGAGTALAQPKRIATLAVILADTHHKGLRFGPDFSRLDDLPQVHEGAPVAPGTVYRAYDAPSFVFPGATDTDARLCLTAASPRPATVVGMATHDKA